MEGILQQLSEYAASEVYPFHMPGHKRNMPEEISRLAGAAKLDITEIEGFDDLHAPKGILLEAQERAAAVFGADETFFSGKWFHGRNSYGGFCGGAEGQQGYCGEELP